jgi:3',5'-cyclic AMP phosphodiesterase CpdA
LSVFVLAHLSDPHLPAVPRARLRELVGKRAIGLTNWRLRRRIEHRVDVLEAVLADLAAQTVDHIAVTGDLVNVALPGEFEGGADFLARLGPPDRVTLVPGNHDAYVPAAIGFGRRHWDSHMRGDGAPAEAAARFPFVRVRGPVALVGLSTAVPTGPFMAWGRLGMEQIERLGGVLSDLSRQNLFRIVLLHHPPVAAKRDRFKRLKDAEPFRRLLQKHGAELILHGHHHVRSLAWIDGPHAPIPVVGVPSASAIGHHDDRAGYNLYRIEPGQERWRCEMISRGLAGEGTVLEQLQRGLLERKATSGGASQ